MVEDVLIPEQSPVTDAEKRAANPMFASDPYMY
jgi:hypothetical protein